MQIIYEEPTGVEQAAVDAVLIQLERYEGEIVAAHQHLLHDAVVHLETFCLDNRRLWPSTEQPFRLYSPAREFWYKLLWASRHDKATFPVETHGLGFHPPANECTTNTNPKAAMLWAAKLTAELRKWLTKFPHKVEA